MPLFDKVDDLAELNRNIERQEDAKNFPVYLARRPIVEAILIAHGILAVVFLLVYMVVSALR